MLNSKIITLVLALTAVTLAVPAHAQNAFAVEQDREVMMQRQWQMQADINELLWNARAKCAKYRRRNVERSGRGPARCHSWAVGSTGSDSDER